MQETSWIFRWHIKTFSLEFEYFHKYKHPTACFKAVIMRHLDIELIFNDLFTFMPLKGETASENTFYLNFSRSFKVASN